MVEPPPGKIVDGVSVKELMVDGSSTPPGLRVSTVGDETRVRPFPVVGSGMYPMVKFKGTSVGALTTAVGRSKLSEVASAASESGCPAQSGGTRDPPPCRLTPAPNGEWGSVSVAVRVTSLPPSVLLVESVSGGGPIKQASAATGNVVFSVIDVLVGPVRQPTAQAWEKVQLSGVPGAPPAH